MNYCRKCGNKLKPESRFCPECGYHLQNENQNIPDSPPPSHVTPPLPPHVILPPPAPVTPSPPVPISPPPQQFIPPVKKKSKKGLLISLLAFAFIVFVTAVFIVYKIFFSGPHKMIADYKEPETNKIVRLENKGMAPANMFAVVLKDDCGKSDAKDVAKLVNGKVVGEIELNNLYQIEFDGKSKEDLYAAIEKAKTSDKVLFAFPDAALRFDGPENSSCNSFDDPFYDGDNGKPYEMINLKKAWDIIKATGVKLNDVTVGVVDTDINYDSDELKSGKSLIVPVLRKDMNEKNELTHGTMVTEIIAANNDNGGMSGVASVLGDKLTVNTTTSGDIDWKEINNKNVNPDDLSEFNASEVGYQSATFAVEAMKNIQKQIDYGATIINCSFGNQKDDYTDAQHQYFSKIYRNFLVKVQKKYPDVIIVGSAGNDSRQIEKDRIWSHKLDNLVTVGAVDKDKVKSGYSNCVWRGSNDDEVTVVACGDIKMEDGKIRSGTSFATPQVTGLIALLRSIDPKLTPAEIKKILTGTSKEVSGGGFIYKSNLIQADDAVLQAIEKVTGKKYDKKKLLALSDVELKSDGSSPEFTVTATVEAVGEKGTSLQIECIGGDYAFGGNSVKQLTSPGSVNWSLTIPDKDKKLTVKVTRLDTKVCRTILVGGEMKAEDLVGEWTGGVSYDNWSTPIAMARKQIEAKLPGTKGAPMPTSFTFKLISKNSLSIDIKGFPMPTVPFEFSDGTLTCSGYTYRMTTYNYTAKVTQKGDVYSFSGTWSTKATNGTLDINGKWNGTMKKK
jgi:hypothetical protein